MSDLSGQNVRVPASPEKPALSGTRDRAPAMVAQVAAFLCGALAIAGIFQLARSAPYLGGAGLFAGVVTGTIAALLARSDVSLRIATRLVGLAAAGVAVALIVYIIALNIYSPGPQSALSYIQPVDGTNHGVPVNGIASFAVTVPLPQYRQLTISFSVANVPNPADNNCINGSQEDITPRFGAALGQVLDIATGTTGIVQIPQGISSFTLGVEFQPQGGQTVCDMNIQVAYAQFSD